MTIMFTPFGSNEFHYVKIKEIKDNSYYDTPRLVLTCTGGVSNPSKRSSTGLQKDTYKITVVVYGILMSFVQNELSIGDTIYIVGHTSQLTFDGRFKQRITIADQIYKAEWSNYFYDVRSQTDWSLNG